MCTLKRLSCVVLGLILIGWAALPTLEAQVASAKMGGRVQDSSGAVIPGADIEMTLTATNELFHAITTETGDYSLFNLPVGVYQIKASMPGFKTEVRTGIKLDVGRSYRIDFMLTVGEVTQEVEVTSEAPLLKKDSVDFAQVIDSQKIVDLPLNGRDVIGSLAALAPGITPAPGVRVGANTFGRYNIRGMRTQDTLVLVDGSMLSQNNGVMTYVQHPDSVQEFEIKTGLYGAEYGIRPGGVISMVTKSGTNQPHGALFWFHRNDNLDARNFFDRGPRPEFKRNQYGATLGGPIYIPGLFNGKDKAWFFISFEGQTERRFRSFTGIVPTAAEKSGRFAGQITDPTTGAPFPNNTIPAERINAISKKFLPFWPEPNTPGTLNYTCSGCSVKDDRNQIIAKADFKTSEADRWSSRFIWDSFPIRHENPIQIFSRIDPLGTWAWNLVNTHTFSPTVVNELGFHYFRRPYSPGLGDPSGSPQEFSRNLGLPNFPRSTADQVGVPRLSVPGFLGLGDPNWLGEAPIGNPEVKENLSFYKGSHAFKMGYQYRRNFSFNTFSFRSSINFAARYTGNAFADFLLGHPVSASLGADTFWGDLSQNSHFAYFQDDWKVSSRLTLNLGLRYEYRGAWKDGSGLSSNFNIRTGQLDPPFVEVPNLPPDQTGRYEAGVPLVEMSRKAFLPRLGIAYLVTPKTVIRSGYGAYANEPYFNHYWFLGGNPRQNAVARNSFSDLKNPTLSLSDPFTPSAATGSALASASGIESPLPLAVVHSWGLSVQQELSSNTSFEIGYQGSRSLNEVNLVKFNDASPGPGPLQQRRPFPNFSTIDMIIANGDTTYHGLEMTFQRRSDSGLSVLAAYTFSKSIDIASAGREAISPNVTEAFNRGMGEGSIPGRFSLTTGYRSPFGRGGRFQTSRALGAILGGWSVLGILTFQNGGYLTASMPSDSLNVGSTASFRPDLVKSPNLPSGQRTPQRWFDTSAFATPAPFRYGNAGRGIIEGTGLKNLDLALLRDFFLDEEVKLQFRFEAFNITNHTNFRDPSTTFGTGSFGVIGSAYDARDLQFGLKLIF